MTVESSTPPTRRAPLERTDDAGLLRLIRRNLILAIVLCALLVATTALLPSPHGERDPGVRVSDTSPANTESGSDVTVNLVQQP